MSKQLRQKLIVILGPTASGKSEWALRLAQKFNGEIVSADSRQIYREMNIGTAKPSKKQIKAIPHHLIGIVYPNEKFNAAIFKKLALEAIKDIQDRDKLPFLVGGTGLYIKSIVDNLTFPPVGPQKKLRQKLEHKSASELFKIYQQLDREGANSIEKDNPRRLIRAIEVSQTTDRPFWQQRKKDKPLFDILQIGLRVSEKETELRISQRTDKMIRQGLGKEVEVLVKKYGWETPALQTIGYQEWKNLLSSTLTNVPIQEIKKEIVLHTLQYAKYQRKWFRNDKRIRWVRNYPEAEKLLYTFLK